MFHSVPGSCVRIGPQYYHSTTTVRPYVTCGRLLDVPSQHCFTATVLSQYCAVSLPTQHAFSTQCHRDQLHARNIWGAHGCTCCRPLPVRHTHSKARVQSPEWSRERCGSCSARPPAICCMTVSSSNSACLRSTTRQCTICCHLRPLPPAVLGGLPLRSWSCDPTLTALSL